MGRGTWLGVPVPRLGLALYLYLARLVSVPGSCLGLACTCSCLGLATGCLATGCLAVWVSGCLGVLAVWVSWPDSREASGIQAEIKSARAGGQAYPRL